MADVLGWAVVGVPVTNVVVMGVFGYPIYRRLPNGMSRFQRSGFHWWYATLAALVALSALALPELFDLLSPSGKATVGWSTVALWGAVGVLGALLVEVLDDRLGSGTGEAAQRYDDGLPSSMRTPTGLVVGLVAMAVLEEAVFRGVGLGYLIEHVGLAEPLAAGITSIVFGISHVWYGRRQVVLKSFVGAAFAAAALGGGWLLAAAAHVVFNLAITFLSPGGEPARAD